MRRIWAAILATFGAKSYATALEFTTLLVTARLLGPHGRGLVASVMAWAGLFAAFFGLSLGQVLVHRLTAGASEKARARLIGSLVYVSIALSTLAWISAVVVYRCIGAGLSTYPMPLLVLGFALVPFMMWDSYLAHLLSAFDHLRNYNRALVISRSLGFAVMLVTIIYAGFGVYAPIFGTFMSLTLVVAISGCTLKLQLKAPFQSDWQEIKSLVGGGIKLHINTIGSYLLMQMDVVMISEMRGTSEVAWYQAAGQLVGAPLLLCSMTTMVMFSRIAHDGPDKMWSIQRRLIAQIMALMIVLAGAGYAVAPRLIPMLLGPQFVPSVEVFRILLLAMVGMAFSQLLVPQWIGRGLFLPAGIITIVVGIVNMVANIMFIPTYGMLAAAWSTVGAFSIAVLSNGAFFLWINRRRSTDASDR